jgi:hypothetical protein
MRPSPFGDPEDRGGQPIDKEGLIQRSKALQSELEAISRKLEEME